jgi:hypothetical protein
MVSFLRAQVRRRLPSDFISRCVIRSLQPQRPPQTAQEWKRLIVRIDNLRALRDLAAPGDSPQIVACALDSLERRVFSRTGAIFMLQALDAFTRVERLSSSERCRLAKIALRWAAEMEEQQLWDNETLHSWARVCWRLGAAGSETPGFSRSIQYILSAQSSDGSWRTDLLPEELPEWQSHYLLGAVRWTSVAVEGLCGALLAAESGC